MGYNNEIKFVLSNCAYTEMTNDSQYFMVESIVDKFNKKMLDGSVLYWNDNNSNITPFQIDELVNFLQNTLSSFDYLFIRKGDEWFDIQIHGEYYVNPFNLRLISKISMI